MKNQKAAKHSLFLSVLALVVCCSMLVGSTLAWFTDEVSSLNNVITAGNLDADVYYDNNGTPTSIQDVSKLFGDITWEPGVVAYENLTVKNLGTLALQYSLTIDFGNENFVVDTEGNETTYGLSSALKVAVLDGKITATDRDALVGSVTEWTSLKDLLKQGTLYPTNNIPTDDQGNAIGVSEKEYGVIIYWEPADEDNNWNVQNGKGTTDGEPLHIDLGITLIANQVPHEEDSFNNGYDAMAGQAVPSVPVHTEIIDVTAYDIFGIGKEDTTLNELELDVYSFIAEDFVEEYPLEQYQDWTCDFFVSTDKPVDTGLILIGTYPGFDWLGFWVPANDQPYEPTGLLGLVSSGGVSNWTYQAIHDGVEVFRCGLLDLDDLNSGVTVTVELRMTSPDATETISVRSIQVTLP